MKVSDYKIKLGSHKVLPDINDFHTMIYNTTAGLSCPSFEKGLCQVPCYAVADEIVHSNVVPSYRLGQEIIWKTCDQYELLEMFQTYIDRKRANIGYLRLNEAGDLETIEDCEKVLYLAEHLDLKIYFWTANIEIWQYISKHRTTDNIVVISSKPEFMADSQHLAIEPAIYKNLAKGSLKCKPNQKCGPCQLCFFNQDSGRTIYTQIRRKANELITL